MPTTILAMAGPYIVRRYVSLRRLRTNNEVAGFKFATIGVIYAVLLAFAVVIVWERYNQADSDVAREASAAATIYRLSRGVDDGHGVAIRSALTHYLTVTVEHDWPAMDTGHSAPAARQAMSAVYEAVLKYHAADPNETVVLAELLRQVDQLSETRRARLVAADGIVPGLIWATLFSGALLTIAFTFFFGTENLRAQSLMTGALAILIFSGLLTIIEIDHPFAGSVKVGPEALAAVLRDFRDY
ncbi:MAG: DUF4239 domain-containing protein [Pseudolabrys sp.]|nr:DUF4239 domain-containing protein [Pseudolabrys sp.]